MCNASHAALAAPRKVALLLLLVGSLITPESWAAKVPKVVTSVKPIHSLVAGIMQGVGEAELLVDGPAPPWAFRPNEAQRKAIVEADLVVWTGMELEPNLAPLLGATGPNQVVYEVLADDELKILPARGAEGARDAFFWLDSRNMLILLDSLTRLLIQIDPENAASYERNRTRTFTTIAETDRMMEYGYREVSGVPVYLFHDTHQYFEQAYAMYVTGTVASPPGKSDGIAASLLKIKASMAGDQAVCMFTERNLDEPHLELLLADTDIAPVELDSLGSDLAPGPGFYVKLMQQNFATIAGCVKAHAPKTEVVAAQPLQPDVTRFPDQVTPRYLLVDQFGRTVSNNDFAGRFQLVNFGYTHCPDVCPTSLSVMSRSLRLLGPDAEQVQPIFITVDPARDTREVLKQYVAYFHPRLLGLSSSPAMIKRTAELFKAHYEKVPAPDGNPDGYTMDHTASLYLLGRNGEFITKFAHGLPAQEVAKRIRTYLVR